MLTRLRERSALVAALLAALLGAIGAPHSVDPRHDSDLTIVLVAHDEASHRLRSPGSASDTPDSHCVLCHFARSFRPRIDGRIVSAPPARLAGYLDFEVFAVSPAAPSAQPPLRAPPASPDSV